MKLLRPSVSWVLGFCVFGSIAFAGGEGVPTPADRRRPGEAWLGEGVYDLADSEKYWLEGQIQLRTGDFSSGSTGGISAAFIVDLKKHPWLATHKRKLRPDLPLMGPASRWLRFDGKAVQILAIAHGTIRRPERSLAWEYETTLEVLKVTDLAR